MKLPVVLMSMLSRISFALVFHKVASVFTVSPAMTSGFSNSLQNTFRFSLLILDVHEKITRYPVLAV